MSQYEYETYNIPDRDYYPGCEDEPTDVEPPEPDPTESETPDMDTDTLVTLTDDRGVASCSLHEPEPSSVILTEGAFGTAWQRYFNDGLWHRVGGTQTLTWTQLLETKRNIRLAYDAPVRKR